ncbi:MAG: hypothetical protein KDB22_26060 [Planctomycetales bacterium]|nr:hypothetical protein [Planctomycetales bacterium]
MNRRLLLVGWLSVSVPCMALIVGCGGNEDDANSTVAQASSSGAGSSSGSYEESYDGGSGGGNPYGAEDDYGAGYGGGSSYGGDYNAGDSTGGGYNGGGSNGGYPGGDGGYGGYGGAPDEGFGQGMGDYAGSGSDMYGSGYDGGYDGYGGSGYGGPGYGGPGYGGAMGGYGQAGAGGTQSGFALVNQFVNQNCGMCHLGRASRGDVSLVGINANPDDARSTELLSSIVAVLEDGSMPPPNRQRPNPLQQQQVIAWIQENIGSVSQDLFASATRSFSAGRETEGVDFLIAHLVSGSPEEANALLSQTRWFAAQKRPATVLRFAVGVDLDAPSTLDDLKPIGSKQMGGAGGGGEYGGSMSGGESYGGGRSGNQAGGRAFQSLTGDFGKAFVGAFEARWAAGDLGTIFNEVVAAPAASNNQPGTGAGMGGGQGRMMGDQGYGGYDGGAGYSGEGSYGGGSYGGGMYGGGSQSGGASSRTRTLPGKAIVPGLIYIGTGSRAELLAKAGEAGVDGLFLFDVKAESNPRNRMVNNDTRVSLLQMDGKSLGATRTLNNLKIEREGMLGEESDDVQKNVDRLFRAFDENMTLTSMPSLLPEHALARMAQVLSDSKMSPLAKLFEARLYHSLNLLSDEELSMAYQITLKGNEGESLATGTPEDKKLVMQLVIEDQSKVN